MKTAIPLLEPSDFFIREEIKVPCLNGIGKNSSFPKLGELERLKKKKDPSFDIFLRAKKPTTIAKWQKEMLERLFKKGELMSAIEQGFAEYKGWQDKSDLELEKEFWDDVKANGVLRHVVLSTIVIDDIKKQVLLSLHTDSEGNLDEHGICIAFEKNKWCFNQGDHFNDYELDIQSKATANLWNNFTRRPRKKLPWRPMPRLYSEHGNWIRRKPGRSENAWESRKRQLNGTLKRLEIID